MVEKEKKVEQILQILDEKSHLKDEYKKIDLQRLLLKKLVHLENLTVKSQAFGSEETLDIFTKRISYQIFNKNDFLYHEKDKCDYVYIILKGEVFNWEKKDSRDINIEIDLNKKLKQYQKGLNAAENQNEEQFYKQKIEETQISLYQYRNTDYDQMLLQNKNEKIKYQVLNDIVGYKVTKILKKNDFIGEKEAVSELKFEKTIQVASEKLIVLKIKSYSFVSLFDLQIKKIEFITKILQNNFPNAKFDSLRYLSYSAEDHFFGNDQVIFQEGDPIDNFYIIREGNVEISKNMIMDALASMKRRSVISNKSIQLQKQSEGCMFGIEGLLQKNFFRYYKAQAKNIPLSLVYSISKKSLNKVILENLDESLRKDCIKLSKIKMEWIESQSEKICGFNKGQLQAQNQRRQSIKQEMNVTKRIFGSLIEKTLQKQNQQEESLKQINEEDSDKNQNIIQQFAKRNSVQITSPTKKRSSILFTDKPTSEFFQFMKNTVGSKTNLDQLDNSNKINSNNKQIPSMNQLNVDELTESNDSDSDSDQSSSSSFSPLQSPMKSPTKQNNEIQMNFNNNNKRESKIVQSQDKQLFSLQQIRNEEEFQAQEHMNLLTVMPKAIDLQQMQQNNINRINNVAVSNNNIVGEDYSPLIHPKKQINNQENLQKLILLKETQFLEQRVYVKDQIATNFLKTSQEPLIMQPQGDLDRQAEMVKNRIYGKKAKHYQNSNQQIGQGQYLLKNYLNKKNKNEMKHNLYSSQKQIRNLDINNKNNTLLINNSMKHFNDNVKSQNDLNNSQPNINYKTSLNFTTNYNHNNSKQQQLQSQKNGKFQKSSEKLNEIDNNYNLDMASSKNQKNSFQRKTFFDLKVSKSGNLNPQNNNQDDNYLNSSSKIGKTHTNFTGVNFLDKSNKNQQQQQKQKKEKEKLKSIQLQKIRIIASNQKQMLNTIQSQKKDNKNDWENSYQNMKQINSCNNLNNSSNYYTDSFKNINLKEVNNFQQFNQTLNEKLKAINSKTQITLHSQEVNNNTSIQKNLEKNKNSDIVKNNNLNTNDSNSNNSGSKQNIYGNRKISNLNILSFEDDNLNNNSSISPNKNSNLRYSFNNISPKQRLSVLKNKNKQQQQKQKNQLSLNQIDNSSYNDLIPFKNSLLEPQDSKVLINVQKVEQVQSPKSLSQNNGNYFLQSDLKPNQMPKFYTASSASPVKKFKQNFEFKQSEYYNQQKQKDLSNSQSLAIFPSNFNLKNNDNNNKNLIQKKKQFQIKKQMKSSLLLQSQSLSNITQVKI